MSIQIITEINNVLDTTDINLDYGLTTILSGIQAARDQQAAATLGQDLSVGLNRRGCPEIGARIALTTWNTTGSLGALNLIKSFMLENRKRLKADLRDFTKTFADILKGTDQKKLLHKMSGEELHILFSLVERLGACSVQNDTALIDMLAKKVEEETEQAAYSIIREFLGIYQDITAEEAIEDICRLRRKLYDQFDTMVNLNPDTAPVIDYLISVSHARTYVAAREGIVGPTNRCSICSRYYDEDDSDDPWLSEVLEPLATECTFCKERPVGDLEHEFISSVERDLRKYDFLPSVRLFWDVHETCKLGHVSRCTITKETASRTGIYNSARMKWLYLDSNFDEKT